MLKKPNQPDLVEVGKMTNLDMELEAVFLKDFLCVKMHDVQGFKHTGKVFSLESQTSADVEISSMPQLLVSQQIALQATSPHALLR